MPGFYKRRDNAMHWQTFARLPGSGSLEMSVAEADRFLSETLPRLKHDLAVEECRSESISFHLSMCRPVSGAGYGQICASGTGPVPAWALGSRTQADVDDLIKEAVE